MGIEPLVKSYSALRRETLTRDRGLREKVMTLEEAGKLVHDGDHVAIGGCTVSRTPLAMVWALIRARKRELVISRSITSTEGDLFFASGVSKHVITSWFTQGIVWGVSKVMRHHTENKLARFEEWSHMSIGLRYRAGAMGIPFMPSRTMLGSDVGKRVGDEIKEMQCPFTGRKDRPPAGAEPGCGAHPCAALRRLRQRPARRAPVHGHRHGDGGDEGHPHDRAHRQQRPESAALPTAPAFPSSRSTRWSRRPSVARRTNATDFTSPSSRISTTTPRSVRRIR